MGIRILEIVIYIYIYLIPTIINCKIFYRYCPLGYYILTGGGEKKRGERERERERNYRLTFLSNM